MKQPDARLRPRILWSAAILPLLTALALQAAASPVAMVTDLEGAATAKERRALSVLDEIELGSTITLSSGSKLVFVYYSSGVEYGFAGPGRLKVLESAPEVMAGKPPLVRRLLAGGERSTRISPSGKIQASLVMRGEGTESSLVLLGPLSKIVETRPRFTWERLPQAERYRFELVDEDLQTVAHATLTDTSYELDQGIVLPPGLYTWEVETRLPGAIRAANWGVFTVASVEERELLNGLRPPPGASFSERVVYAVWLQQTGFLHDAQQAWRQLKDERPELRLPD
jgi:hypothetical protein